MNTENDIFLRMYLFFIFFSSFIWDTFEITFWNWKYFAIKRLFLSNDSRKQVNKWKRNLFCRERKRIINLAAKQTFMFWMVWFWCFFTSGNSSASMSSSVTILRKISKSRFIPQALWCICGTYSLIIVRSRPPFFLFWI